MSRENEIGRLSAVPFLNLEEIAEAQLPEIQHGETSLDHPSRVSVSSLKSTSPRTIPRGERCFLTGYTHEQAHFLNAARRDVDRKVDIQRLLTDLGIVHKEFHLDSAANLVNLDRSVHKAMNAYALIALTCSLETLDGLTREIERDIAKDSRSSTTTVKTQVANSTFLRPKYNIVALHPEHFLPASKRLVILDPATSTIKTYVCSRDRMLREGPEPSNPAIHVLLLIRKATDLVELLYRRLHPTPGTQGEKVWLMERDAARRNDPRAGRPKVNCEMGTSEPENDVQTPSGSRFRERSIFPEGASQERRMEIAALLISGRDGDYDTDDEEVIEELRAGSIVPALLQPQNASH